MHPGDGHHGLSLWCGRSLLDAQGQDRPDGSQVPHCVTALDLKESFLQGVVPWGMEHVAGPLQIKSGPGPLWV